MLILKSVNQQKYDEALLIFNHYLDTIPEYSNRKEVLYLKRLGNLPIVGRDIVFFYPRIKFNPLIFGHLDEYIECIDAELRNYQSEGRKLSELLTVRVPVFDDLKNRYLDKYETGLNLLNWEISKEEFEYSDRFFNESFLWCINGLIFPIFPDPIRYSRTLEEYNDPYTKGLWVIYPPEFINKITDNGFHINWIDVYSTKDLSKKSQANNPRNFESISTISDLEYWKYFSTSSVTSVDYGKIFYTGRTHTIENTKFFEVRMNRPSGVNGRKIFGNPFLETVYQVLRNGENRIRSRYGMRHIGEGWVSEMLMFNLVKDNYPDALHHFSPKWLSPQHLDVYIPSLKIAIEYQGKQHYEPISFFGGKEALEKNKVRDNRKRELCKRNEVRLLYWDYFEAITYDVLINKMNGG